MAKVIAQLRRVNKDDPDGMHTLVLLNADTNNKHSAVVGPISLYHVIRIGPGTAAAIIEWLAQGPNIRRVEEHQRGEGDALITLNSYGMNVTIVKDEFPSTYHFGHSVAGYSLAPDFVEVVV